MANIGKYRHLGIIFAAFALSCIAIFGASDATERPKQTTIPLSIDQHNRLHVFLTIAGETGTLINRFKDTPLQGKLIAKTGTLTGVSALSGYFPHEDSQTWVAFSILVNHSNQPASVLRQAMDDLLVAIAETPRHCLSQP